MKYFAQYEAHRKHSINVSVVTISFIITMTSRLERAYYLRLLGLASQTHVAGKGMEYNGTDNGRAERVGCPSFSTVTFDLATTQGCGDGATVTSGFGQTR